MCAYFVEVSNKICFASLQPQRSLLCLQLLQLAEKKVFPFLCTLRECLTVLLAK